MRNLYAQAAFLWLALVLAGSASGVANRILKYPAVPSPNSCTENWGEEYFMRAVGGYCQACNTVSQEYKAYWKICEFTVDPTIEPEVEPEELDCTSNEYGAGAYSECTASGDIAAAQIVEEFSADGVECKFNVNWGHKDDFLWVSRGCSALFRVCVAGTRCRLTPAVDPTPEPVCQPYRPAGWITYTIQSGDSLLGLARRTGSVSSTLQKVNCIPDPNRIVTGTKIFLPRWPDPKPPLGDDEVIVIPLPPEGPGRPEFPEAGVIRENIYCASIDEMPDFCSIPGQVMSVSVLSEVSPGKCTLGETFGIDRSLTGIWVDMGCAASFSVTYQPN